MRAVALDIEQELLCRLVSSADGVTGGVVRLPPGIDWPRTLRLATHALFPLLARRLDRVEGESVPDDVRAQLQAALRGNGIAHLMRIHGLRAALASLQQHGVPALVLKGIALAHLVYPDPTLRPMQDIDLWVPPGRLDQAAAALRDAGFRFPRRSYEGLWTPGEPTADVDRALEIPNTPIFFELHGSLPSWAGLPAAVSETAWTRAREMQIDGIAMRVLAPEDMLLHVGLHLSRRHVFRSGLGGLLDLRFVVERWRDQWNWEELADVYLRLGVDQWMRLAFHLARDLVAAPIPDSVMQTLPKPQCWGEMETLALRQVWSAGSFLPHALERLAGATQGPSRATWVRNRLLTYVRGRPWEAVRRFWFDLALKLPRYARLWMRGELRGDRFRMHLQLGRERARLEALLNNTPASRTDRG